MPEIKILNKTVLRTKLEELSGDKISFDDFKEWIFEVITSDFWNIENSKDENLLKKIIFTFDDDSIKWTGDLGVEIAKIAIGCLDLYETEKAEEKFSEKVEGVLKEG